MTARIAFALSLVLSSATGCASAGTDVKAEQAAATPPPASTARKTAADFVMDGRYPIMVYRTLETGDEFFLYSASKTVQDTVAEVRGQVAKRESTTTQSELEAAVTVLAVSDKRPLKLRYVIGTFTIDGKPALTPGQVVELDLQGKRRVVFEGGAEPPEATVKELYERLRYVLSESDEQMLRGPSSRRPAERWPIDPVAFVKGIGTKEEISVRPEDVAGNATFVGLEPMAGHDCALVESDIDIRAFEMRQPNENAHLLGGRMHIRLHMLVPVDPARRDLYSTRADVGVDLTMKVIGTNAEALVKGHYQSTHVMTLQPIEWPVD